MTSRLALDRLRSAQHRREAYVGPWLPEPTTSVATPDELAERAESLTIGFLAVLERLGPVERVVFLLADVFAVPFDEIATVVDKTPRPAARWPRARRRIREARPRFAPTDEEAWAVTAAFLTAAQQGDLDALVDLLADDAVAVSDGGADVHAARRPVVAGRIPRFLVNLTRRLTADDEVIPVAVNGQPALAIRRHGRTTMAVVVAVADGQVQQVWSILNPDKLARLDAELGPT
ncbi:MAG: hypothetical protein R2746_14010 [Acidimicrobiales bacterium]